MLVDGPVSVPRHHRRTAGARHPACLADDGACCAPAVRRAGDCDHWQQRKTTTRQLTASVLRAHFGDHAVLCRRRQFQQSHWRSFDTAAAASAASRGRHRNGHEPLRQLTLLTSLVTPDIAVITNAGPAHLEALVRLWRCRAKAKIFTGLRTDGVAVSSRRLLAVLGSAKPRSAGDPLRHERYSRCAWYPFGARLTTSYRYGLGTAFDDGCRSRANTTRATFWLLPPWRRCSASAPAPASAVWRARPISVVA